MGDPNEQDLSNALLPPAWLEGGSLDFVLGTDHLGRDILTRLVYGARSSLFLGVASVGAAGFIGAVIGVLAAEWGGAVDEALMRIADVQLSIPFILLAITVLTLLGGSVGNMILILVLSGWVAYARVIRSELMRLRELEFVLAARSAGASRFRIARKHLLPNATGLMIVVGTLQLADVILLAASLSFLGVGLQPPAVDWGSMLADGRDYLTTEWWIATMPGIAITIVILAVNLVGDWMRDVFDPRMRGKL
jgi:peptide/nickel transport system permease protein